MSSDPPAERLWRAYLAAVQHDHSDTLDPSVTYTAERFGDSPQLADELADLIAAGTKTATCSALAQWDAEVEPLSRPGVFTVVLDGHDHPRCVIETTEVTLRRFIDVDARFAYEEGEGERTLASWRRDHWAYFTRALAPAGQEPTEDMVLVCERFRLVFDGI